MAFLISACYRPPNSNNDVFYEFDLFLRKCDLENKELMIVGDINCDFAKAVPDSHTRRLQLSCSLYQLDQLIIEPLRVTGGPPSATLIDLFFTNKPLPENISNSGVIHLGISDHGKTEYMLLGCARFIGPLQQIKLDESVIKLVNTKICLGLKVDSCLKWDVHALEVVESFNKKLNLLKSFHFLPLQARLDFYFKVTLPSITNGIFLFCFK